MLEKRIYEGHEVVDKFNNVTSSTTLGVNDLVVRADASDGAITITLPPVSEMAGKTVAIMVRDASNNVTVQDQDDSEDWDGDITMTAAKDKAVLYSDGFAWYRLVYSVT